MKLIFFLLVLLKNGMNPTEGLQVIYSSGQIILKYSFKPPYNSHEKFCCKLVLSKCSSFVTNSGQADLFFLKRRDKIFIKNYNGGFEVIITDPIVMDAGIYMCGVRRFPGTHESVEVTVSDLKDLSGVNTAPLSPKSSIKPTVWPSSSSAPIVSENDAEKLSDDWETTYTLAAVLTVLVFAVISVTLLVYRLKARKKKSTEKSGTCGSANTTMIALSQDGQIQYVPITAEQQVVAPEDLEAAAHSAEQNSVVYSMVDFKPHQDPSEIYANLQIHSPGDTDASSRCTFTTEGSVEYSTILRAPA